MSDPNLSAAIDQIRAAQAPAKLMVQGFFDEPTFTASYVVHDPGTKRGAVVDSVLDFDQAAGRTSTASADAIVAFVEREGITIDWLLETHAHADHLSAAPYLQEKLGGKLAIGREIITVQNVFGKIFNVGTEFARDGSEFDRLFDDGDRFAIGDIPAMALHVPGHTPADMAYVIGDAVFTGDTMFMPDLRHRASRFPGRRRAQALSLDPPPAGAARRDAAFSLPRLQGAGPRQLRLGDDGRRGAAEQHPCP